MKLKKGQALVTLLVFSATAIIITAGAVTVTIINSRSTGTFTQAEEVLQATEAAADNAILRLLREPSYSVETVTINSTTATINVSGTTVKTITVRGLNGNTARKIQIVGSYTNNKFTIASWQEIDD